MKPAYWNLVSLGLPAAAMLIAAAMLMSSSRMGSPGGLADGIGGIGFALMVLALPFALGETAAITSIVRQERWMGLALIGAMANGVGLLCSLYLIYRVIDANR